MLAENEVITTLQDLFSSLLGSVPPEFEGLLYLFFVMFLFYVTDLFFNLLRSVFEVRKWRR